MGISIADRRAVRVAVFSRSAAHHSRNPDATLPAVDGGIVAGTFDDAYAGRNAPRAGIFMIVFTVRFDSFRVQIADPSRTATVLCKDK